MIDEDRLVLVVLGMSDALPMVIC